MNEAIWPIFIAAPFISPRTEAIFRAVWRCLFSMCSCEFSSERATFAATVPAYLVAWLPIAVPTFRARPARVAADRRPDLRRAPEPGLGNPPLLLVRLRRAGPPPVAQIGAKDL